MRIEANTDPAPNPVVSVGDVRFGNALPRSAVRSEAISSQIHSASPISPCLSVTSR